jgi:hypothetical protein
MELAMLEASAILALAQRLRQASRQARYHDIVADLRLAVEALREFATTQETSKAPTVRAEATVISGGAAPKGGMRCPVHMTEMVAFRGVSFSLGNPFGKAARTLVCAVCHAETLAKIQVEVDRHRRPKRGEQSGFDWYDWPQTKPRPRRKSIFDGLE